MSDTAQSVTVVICTKNEEATIGEVLNGIKPYAQDILVVDGHSTDATRDIAKAHGAKVGLDNKLGKGAAIRMALEYLQTDIVVFIDADCSHDPADIPKLIAPIADDEADLVIGCRITGGSDELAGDWGSFCRNTGSQIINLIVNWRFHVHLTDIQNGFRAVRMSCSRDLNLIENITTIEQEMSIKALKGGWRVMNIPSHEYRRKAGISRINAILFGPRYVWQAIRDTLLS